MSRRLTEHFTEDEFRCRCARCRAYPMAHVPIARELVISLEHLRDMIASYYSDARGFDPRIFISSGYRCPAHNAMVNGVPDSWHTAGMAADIRHAKLSPLRVAAFARSLDGSHVFSFVQRGDDYVHVDIRDDNI